MSKHRVLSFKPQLRLEWRGQDGQSETEQPDHSASLGDSITSSTWIRFSVYTGIQWFEQVWFAGKHSDIGGSSGKRIEVVGRRAGAVMHPSVYRRFDHEAVRLTDAFGAYRPLTLRRQDDFKRFYNPSAQFPANSYHGAACLARGLYPVLQLPMKPLAGRGSSGERQQDPPRFFRVQKGGEKIEVKFDSYLSGIWNRVAL
jgi:hypothetical protein